MPVEFLPHLASGEIQNSATSGKWDVAFLPVDDERKKFVDFGNAYHLLQSTYLVAPGSKIKTVEDANAPDVRIGGVANTATFRAAQRTAPKATYVAVRRGRCRDRRHEGRPDRRHRALARVPHRPGGKIPGSRMLDGGFLNSSTAVAVRRASRKRSPMSASSSRRQKPPAWCAMPSTP